MPFYDSFLQSFGMEYIHLAQSHVCLFRVESNFFFFIWLLHVFDTKWNCFFCVFFWKLSSLLRQRNGCVVSSLISAAKYVHGRVLFPVPASLISPGCSSGDFVAHAHFLSFGL